MVGTTVPSRSGRGALRSSWFVFLSETRLRQAADIAAFADCGIRSICPALSISQEICHHAVASRRAKLRMLAARDARRGALMNEGGGIRQRDTRRIGVPHAVGE